MIAVFCPFCCSKDTLAGVIIIKSVEDEPENGKGGSGPGVVVHESDEETIEEKAEDGLKESDSEDGPVLDEDNMIDFNGSETKDDHKTNSDDTDEPTHENLNDEEEEEDENSKDTGAWGTFY